MKADSHHTEPDSYAVRIPLWPDIVIISVLWLALAVAGYYLDGARLFSFVVCPYVAMTRLINCANIRWSNAKRLFILSHALVGCFVFASYLFWVNVLVLEADLEAGVEVDKQSIYYRVSEAVPPRSGLIQVP